MIKRKPIYTRRQLHTYGQVPPTLEDNCRSVSTLIVVNGASPDIFISTYNDECIMTVNVEKLWIQVRDKKNVVGHHPKLTQEIRSGRQIRGWAFRVYVSRKQPLNELLPNDVLPTSLEGVPVDVVELRDYFKDEVTFNRNLGYFDAYYSTASYILMAFLASCMAGVFLMLRTVSQDNVLFLAAYVMIITSILLGYKGLGKLSAEKLM